MLPPPQIPNKYDDDEQRLQRLEQQDADSRRRSIILLVCGVLAVATLIPLTLMGWGGAGLVIVPVGLGLILAGGVQLVLARFSA